MLVKVIKSVISKYPQIEKHLFGRALWVAKSTKPTEYKTVDFFTNAVERLVRDVYYGFLGGEFIDIMASLIAGQINQAYQRAWMDDGGELPLPDYLQSASEEDILTQYDYVDQFFRDVVDARVDKTPIEPLLLRAGLWANRWNESYNNAVLLIAEKEGGNLQWVYGDSDHCATCESLNGVVASAAEWTESGYQPQGRMLDCGGWRCKCSLDPTNQRRSRNRKVKLGI